MKIYEETEFSANAGVTVPVLILTARDGWRERVEGIDAGADDYLVKPFRMEELTARLRAILRRTAGHASPVLHAFGVELDTRTRVVSLAGREIDLTALEYRLLAFLLHRRGQVVPAGELLDHLHGVGTVTIQVTTTYPGAPPERLYDGVTRLVEEELNGIPGLMYFESTSDTSGMAQIMASRAGL